MKFLTTEEGRIGSLAAINVGFASVQPWTTVSEAVLRNLLLVGQISVAFLTAWYVYRKAKGHDKDKN